MKKLIKGLILFSAACSTLAIADNSLTFTPGALIKSPAMLNVDGTLLTFSPNGEYALFKKGTDYFVYQTSNWKQLSSFQASANQPDFSLLDDDQKVLIKNSSKGYTFFDTLKGISSKREFNSDLVFFLRENEIYFHKVIFPNTLDSRIMSCAIDKLDLNFQAIPDNIYRQSCILFETSEFYGESQHVSRIDHGGGQGYELPNKYVSYAPNGRIKYIFAGTRWFKGYNDWFPQKESYKSENIYYYLPSSVYNVSTVDNKNISIKTNNARYAENNTEVEEFNKNILYIFNGGYIKDGYIIPIILTPKSILDKNKICSTLNGRNSQNISNFEIIPHASKKFVAFSCGDFTTFYKAEDLLNPYLGYDKDVAIDMAMAKITKSISNNDNKEALLYMNYLLTLDVELPEAFYPQYIKVLNANKYSGKVKYIANRYIQKYGKAGKFYGEMIEVLSR